MTQNNVYLSYNCWYFVVSNCTGQAIDREWTPLIDLWKCKIGWHKWERVEETFMPTRRCSHCNKVQGLFRGAGMDDWMDMEE